MHVLILMMAAVLALNIGGSGAASATAVAWGSGVLPRARALSLFSVFVLAGAVLGGHRVTATLSGGLIPAELFTGQVVLVISGAAALGLSLANVLRVPQSTTHVTVAAIAGVGLANGSLHTYQLLRIALAWMLVPLAAFALCYLAARLLYPRIQGWMDSSRSRFDAARGQRYLVVAVSAASAYAIGMNNVANAVAPLVGGQLMSTAPAVALGGLGMALGGLAIGRRVMTTIARDITNLTLLQGALVCFVTAGLTMASAWLGIPVSFVQTTTLAIIGIASGQTGNADLPRQRVMQRIGLTWITSPAAAFLASFWLMP